MTTSSNTPFAPLLTVMVDYGNAPFLWLVDSPDKGGVGGNLCDGTYWEESFPMSEGLWRKFADWAVEFDRTAFYSDNFDGSGWDWIAFHARGLQLSRWLKEDVGDAYRVVYLKPYEDPNHRIDERTEIFADGTLLPLPSFRNQLPVPVCFCQHIISGGQAGADRAALDFAIAHDILHGGWFPEGRMAEDGRISDRYQLQKLPKAGYRQRTRQNVLDSDGTLIVNLGELDGGSLQTQRFAELHGKPCLVIQAEEKMSHESAKRILEWLHTNRIMTLNVAGPRESKRPGIYCATMNLLGALMGSLRKN